MGVKHLPIDRQKLFVSCEEVVVDGGRTPLWYAAVNGHEAVVRLLLARADVDANSKDRGNQTPLSTAAENGHEAVVRLLLARADVGANSKEKWGETPLSTAADGLVSIHPLVHGWARDGLSGSDEERMWTLAVCTMSVSISWTFQTADYRFRKILVPHLDACLNTYADGVFHLGDVGRDCLVMAQRFALSYSEAGRRQEALQLLETVVAANKRTLGEEHPDTLDSIHALTLRYNETGRRQEALQLLGTVMAARKRTLGEEHPDILRSMHNLAVRYSEAGRRQEALQLLETVVAAHKRTLGEKHPDTLHSINNLAILNTTEESAALLPTLSSQPLNTQNRIEHHNTPSTNSIKRFNISRWWRRHK